MPEHAAPADADADADVIESVDVDHMLDAPKRQSELVRLVLIAKELHGWRRVKLKPMKRLAKNFPGCLLAVRGLAIVVALPASAEWPQSDCDQPAEPGVVTRIVDHANADSFTNHDLAAYYPGAEPVSSPAHAERVAILQTLENGAILSTTMNEAAYRTLVRDTDTDRRRRDLHPGNANAGKNRRGFEFNSWIRNHVIDRHRAYHQHEPGATGCILSPYDLLVRPLAAAAGLDWRLVIAQMFQESGLDPASVSFADARGLLQVLPATARDLGFNADRLHEPEIGVAAGVAYLSWTHDRFADLPDVERLWFALAAYNAGLGHVHDGRLLAADLGLDRSRWFDNVESAMLKLAEPNYAREAVHGYVRGTETARYVRAIRKRYAAYIEYFSGRRAGASWGSAR